MSISHGTLWVCPRTGDTRKDGYTDGPYFTEVCPPFGEVETSLLTSILGGRQLHFVVLLEVLVSSCFYDLQLSS